MCVEDAAQQATAQALYDDALMQVLLKLGPVQGKPRVQSAIARQDVTVELNHRTMVRIGLYAAQHSGTFATLPL